MSTTFTNYTVFAGRKSSLELIEESIDPTTSTFYFDQIKEVPLALRLFGTENIEAALKEAEAKRPEPLSEYGSDIELRHAVQSLSFIFPQLKHKRIVSPQQFVDMMDEFIEEKAAELMSENYNSLFSTHHAKMILRRQLAAAFVAFRPNVNSHVLAYLQQTCVDTSFADWCIRNYGCTTDIGTNVEFLGASATDQTSAVVPCNTQQTDVVNLFIDQPLDEPYYLLVSYDTESGSPRTLLASIERNFKDIAVANMGLSSDPLDADEYTYVSGKLHTEFFDIQRTTLVTAK